MKSDVLIEIVENFIKILRFKNWIFNDGILDFVRNECSLEEKGFVFCLLISLDICIDVSGYRVWLVCYTVR